MRPAVAYRLKYRSSSQNSTEPLGVARALEPSRPTETNKTAELRALALEADEIGRAARESRRRAAHMRLPPPHKVEELGHSSSGGPGLPVNVFKKLFTEGDKDAVVSWFDATGPRDINETFTLKTSNAVLGFVFGLPNGVAWNVLSFWQCYYRIRTPNSSGLGGPDDTHWRTGPW